MDIIATATASGIYVGLPSLATLCCNSILRVWLSNISNSSSSNSSNIRSQKAAWLATRPKAATLAVARLHMMKHVASKYIEKQCLMYEESASTSFLPKDSAVAFCLSLCLSVSLAVCLCVTIIVIATVCCMPWNT